MMTDRRITLLGCWALALSGCGMSDPVGMPDPGQHVSGAVVGATANLASLRSGDKSDRAALQALYEATGGKDWSRQDNWLTDAPLDDWYGVQVGNRAMGSAHGRVIRLSLAENMLAGRIPTELGSLVHLRDLSLAENNLTGKIPREFGNLKELEGLQLQHNQLTGSIPSGLGNLSRLRWLLLEQNRLTGKIPEELGDIGYVQQAPHRRTLKVLNLGGNRLRGAIPGTLGRLVDLKDLALEQNRLTGKIPEELGNLKDLRTLTLGGNRLKGKIPSQLGGLVRLDVLDLGGNRLTGKIPAVLDRLRLDVLVLSGNKLTGPLPPGVDARWDLFLDGNRLTGPLPATLLDRRSLDTLYFQKNEGLCAPNTANFVAWLETVKNVWGQTCRRVRGS